MELGLRGRKALVTARHVASAAPAPRSWRKKGATSCWCRAPPPISRRPRQKSPRSTISQRAAFHSISDGKSVDILAAECPETDLLVNNAGAIPRGNIAKMDEARWRTVWDLKVFGYVNMTRRFCALMAARKKGVIINIIGAVGESVQVGLQAPPGTPP
jgi:NAD(P)-dependent dehydrogenase (short-subunit alcohol dehydrogenase family)